MSALARLISPPVSRSAPRAFCAFIIRSISSISTGIKRKASVIIMARVCTGTFITFSGESRRSKPSVSMVGVVVYVSSELTTTSRIIRTVVNIAV